MGFMLEHLREEQTNLTRGFIFVAQSDRYNDGEALKLMHESLGNMCREICELAATDPRGAQILAAMFVKFIQDEKEKIRECTRPVLNRNVGVRPGINESLEGAHRQVTPHLFIAVE